jgi:hypothetical protein
MEIVLTVKDHQERTRIIGRWTIQMDGTPVAHGIEATLDIVADEDATRSGAFLGERGLREVRHGEPVVGPTHSVRGDPGIEGIVGTLVTHEVGVLEIRV